MPGLKIKTFALPRCILILVCFWLTACSQDENSEEEEVTPPPLTRMGDALKGERLSEAWCNSCHVVSETTTAADIGPSWQSIANDPAKTDEYLNAFLAQPHWPMDHIQLSREQITDIVSYIRTLPSP